MAVNYWAEVWPVPGTTPWVPRLDSLDWAVLSATKRNGLGSGSFQIPAGSEQLNQILYKDPDNPANDIESLIRVYRVDDNTVGPALDYEFFADNAPNLLVESGLLQFSGGGIETELDKLRVLPFDYPRRPTLDQHWIFGSDRNIVRNGGFEDNPLAITNQGFEDGTREPWWPGAVEGVSANMAIVTGANVDTGTFAAEITPLLPEGGVSTSIRVVPGSTYTVTARFKAGIGVDYQLGASGPSDIVPLAGAIYATAFGDGFYGPGGQKHEAQTLFTSTGAYQTVTLQFQAGAQQTFTQISIREGEAVLNGQPFYIDVVSVSGNGIGVNPWQSVNVGSFQASNAQADTGTWSGFIDDAGPSTAATTGGYVYQRINGFTLGALYTVSVRVRSPVGSVLWAMEIRDVTGNLLVQEAQSLAANTWTTLTAEFEVPLFLPGPDRALEIRIVNYSGTTADLYLDTVSWIQGQAATTVGDIMLQLMDDANVDHVSETPPFDRSGKPWITYTTFTASLDSNGSAWTDPAISITIREGTRYSDVLNAFVRLGYEWELVPDTVTDGQWELKIYNSGGKGSVLPDEIGLVAGAADIGGPVARSRIPSNWIFTRGSGGEFAVNTSAASIGAVQHQEGYVQALDIDDSLTADLRGADQIAENIDAGVSLQIELAPTDDDHLIPGRDFTVGDALAVTVPGVIVRGVRRCQSHTVTLKAEPGDEAPLTYVVSFLSENYASGGGGGRASVGGADNRIARGLELVMRKLERVDLLAQATTASDPTVIPGPGGHPWWILATLGSSAEDRAIANVICDGVADNADILDGLINHRNVWLCDSGDVPYEIDGVIALGTDDGDMMLAGEPGSRLHLNYNGPFFSYFGGGSPSINLFLWMYGVTFDAAGLSLGSAWTGGGLNAQPTVYFDHCVFIDFHTYVITYERLMTWHLEQCLFVDCDPAAFIDCLGFIQSYCSIINCVFDGSCSGQVTNNTPASGGVILVGFNQLNSVTEADTGAGVKYVHNLHGQTHSPGAHAGAADIDHGGLLGLADDDHTQYFLVDGSRKADFISIEGITGAVSDSRYVGATAAGAPVSGTFAIGDYVIDRSGSIWICITAGSPGTWQQVGGAATDPDAIHDNVAGEIAAITEKTVLADDDWFLLEDSADSDNKKKVKTSNLPGSPSSLVSLKHEIWAPYSIGDADDVWWESDSGDFTEVTITGTQTITEVDGILSVEYQNVGANDINCFLKAHTFSVGDAFVTRMKNLSMQNNYHGGGLIFADGTTGAAELAALGGYHGDGTSKITAINGTITSIGISGTSDIQTYPWLDALYLKLTYTATDTFTPEYSPDGISWIPLNQIAITQTMTPTHFGLWWSNFGGAGAASPGIVSFGPIAKVA